MAKYEVTVEIVYEIEADSENEAEERARDNARGCDVMNVDVLDCEEVD